MLILLIEELLKVGMKDEAISIAIRNDLLDDPRYKMFE